MGGLQTLNSTRRVKISTQSIITWHPVQKGRGAEGGIPSSTTTPTQIHGNKKKRVGSDSSPGRTDIL